MLLLRGAYHNSRIVLKTFSNSLIFWPGIQTDSDTVSWMDLLVVLNFNSFFLWRLVIDLYRLEVQISFPVDKTIIKKLFD